MTKYFVHICTNILFIFLGIHANAQSYAVQRGHADDDLYVYCRKYLTSNSIYQLYRLTANGKNIKVQYTIPYPADDNDLNLKNMVADPTSGLLFCTSLSNADTSVYKSTDFGKSWQWMNTIFNGISPPIALLGGSVAGEIIMTERLSVQEYGIGSTIDFFASHTSNASYGSYFAKPEVGINSGEMYGINNAYTSNRDFLLHSTDFGVTIDTIAIDSAIIYNPNGNLAQKVCHGSLPGEIYLITVEPEQIGFPHVYKIYHSTDYGAAYSLQNTLKFDESSANTDFSGGRGNCSFYAVNWKFDQQLQRQILQIHSSADCGQTFTLFEHDLNTNVSIPETEGETANMLKVSPNPAQNIANIGYSVQCNGNLKLLVGSVKGAKNEIIFENFQTIGDHTLSFDCGHLPSGVYVVTLQQANGYSSSNKLVICK